MVVLGLLIISSCTSTMGGVETASIEINAPVEEVFKHVSDPDNLPHDVDVIESVSNVQGEGQGATFDWIVSGGGGRYPGKAVVTDSVANQKMVFMTTCGKEITILFMPAQGGGTRLIITLQYDAEVPATGKKVRGIVKERVQGMLDGWLANVKEELTAD